jgi:hypothetical protein
MTAEATSYGATPAAIRQINLDQRFFPPPIALDDRRLKGLAPKLRNLEIDSPALVCSVRL